MKRKKRKKNKKIKKKNLYNENIKVWGNYAKFLSSKSWQRQREIVFSERGDVCVSCHTAAATQIHHTKYKELWGSNEELKYLVPLCKNCHKKIHKTPIVKKGVAKKKKD